MNAMIGDSMSRRVGVARRTWSASSARLAVLAAAGLRRVGDGRGIASSRPRDRKRVAWELAWQTLLGAVGCGVFPLNYAVLAVGSQTVGVLSALVPVLGALFAMLIAGDRISDVEWLAIASISSGVVVACLPSRGGRSFVALRQGARRGAMP
jgi:drug/metabolite transporter (DMT)-like permease